MCYRHMAHGHRRSALSIQWMEWMDGCWWRCRHVARNFKVRMSCDLLVSPLSRYCLSTTYTHARAHTLIHSQWQPQHIRTQLQSNKLHQLLLTLNEIQLNCLRRFLLLMPSLFAHTVERGTVAPSHWKQFYSVANRLHTLSRFPRKSYTIIYRN